MYRRQVKVLFSTCVEKSRIAAYSKTVHRLGGQVVEGEGADFTHFVSLPPSKGQARKGKDETGFKKSINSLVALAAGMLLDLALVLHPRVLLATARPLWSQQAVCFLTFSTPQNRSIL